MIIGLLYEGYYDKKPLFKIIGKIIKVKLLRLRKRRKLSFVTYSPNGDIEGSIKIAASLFFDISQCDVGIFVADSGGRKDKCLRIRNLVAKHCSKINPNTEFVCGFPDPELEQWFIDEENAIKKILGLKGNNPIPYPKLKPKERLLLLIEQSNADIADSKLDIYIEIASSLDLKKLCECSKSFKSFYAAIKNAKIYKSKGNSFINL